MGNLGTRFLRNLKVSQEILIVNPTQVSQKCDTLKTTQTSSENYFLTAKNSSLDRKILLVYIGWIFIARVATNPLKGCAPCVTGKNNYFVSQDKYFLWRGTLKNYSCDRKYPSCDAHSTPCNRRNILCHMMKYIHVLKNLPVKERIPPVTKGVWLSVTEGFFLWKKEYILWQEICFLWQE